MMQHTPSPSVLAALQQPVQLQLSCYTGAGGGDSGSAAKKAKVGATAAAAATPAAEHQQTLLRGSITHTLLPSRSGSDGGSHDASTLFRFVPDSSHGGGNAHLVSLSGTCWQELPAPSSTAAAAAASQGQLTAAPPPPHPPQAGTFPGGASNGSSFTQALAAGLQGPTDLVGRRLSVWWPDDKRWFEGRVTDCYTSGAAAAGESGGQQSDRCRTDQDAGRKRRGTAAGGGGGGSASGGSPSLQQQATEHRLLYDDGDVETLDLLGDSEAWQLTAHEIAQLSRARDQQQQQQQQPDGSASKGNPPLPAAGLLLADIAKDRAADCLTALPAPLVAGSGGRPRTRTQAGSGGAGSGGSLSKAGGLLAALLPPAPPAAPQPRSWSLLPLLEAFANDTSAEAAAASAAAAGGAAERSSSPPSGMLPPPGPPSSSGSTSSLAQELLERFDAATSGPPGRASLRVVSKGDGWQLGLAPWRGGPASDQLAAAMVRLSGLHQPGSLCVQAATGGTGLEVWHSSKQGASTATASISLPSGLVWCGEDEGDEGAGAMAVALLQVDPPRAGAGKLLVLGKCRQQQVA